jgi:hypothetical protein
MADMNIVPFTIEVFGGLGECHGIVRDEGTHLAFEFQLTDSIAGVVRSGVRHVKVSLNDLLSVSLCKGWLNTKIIIQAARMEVLQDIPGMIQGQVQLNISRKHRAAAEAFVAGLYQDDGATST